MASALSQGIVPHNNYVTCISEIVSTLIKAYAAQIPINLSKVKQDLARKHKLSHLPKLVDIIAAVPEDYKSKLLPYIKAKPVRTASGVAVVAVMSKPHRCPHIATTGGCAGTGMHRRCGICSSSGHTHTTAAAAAAAMLSHFLYNYTYNSQ